MKSLVFGIASTAFILGAGSLCRGQSDIDLTGYTKTFDDEFDQLSVKHASPKKDATWYDLPPYGAAGFYSKSKWDIAAFHIDQGMLLDEAWKDPSGQWHSGNLSSVDPTGAGFAQQYGYFEMRAKMPDSGNGTWPAFWLMSTDSIAHKDAPHQEIDIFEWYGVSRDRGQHIVQEASHHWGGEKEKSLPGLYSPKTPMPDGSAPWQDFHIYGCKVDPQHITWYIDGVQTNQVATPVNDLQSPFYIMIDYALGGGWPLSGVVDHSAFTVDWVRVYSLPPQ